jgi:serine/threonine protein kinase/tetratricopeptide (TPR) repeat protein
MSDTVPSGAPDPRTDATTALDGSKPVQHGDQAGDTIGAYRLVSVLGEGGFGTVWLAERREPFVQRVALKVIKPGMDSRSVLGRFEQERQALAVMNHPNIARVLDGGMTPAGRPYFVMEYVKGQPITAFCDARRLSIRQRLELFVKVCEAIQHAHLKGIIHRDLKPSNILAFDAESQLPSVKVIDFGVAKAMQPATSAHTVFTETGQMIGTPEYMSPEQADPTSAEIDTRSDIYSLGVLLYELLTGVTPFDARELRSRAYREVQRYIAETDPPAPSTRLSTIGDADLRSRIVQARGQTAEGLMHSLRRELEWIPLMAMRKEPQNRYQSATDLARDVRNYLDGRALVAAPESTGYRIRKFVRRHRVGVATTAAVATALIVGLGVSLWQWREAVAARALAESRAQEAEAVTRFVTDSLVRSDPMQGGDRELTVRQAMRQAMTQLEQRALADQPEVQARLQVAIADILFGNADLDEATTLANRALETLERLHGPDAVEITPALSTLGRIHEQKGAYAQAETSHRRTLAIRRLRVPDNEMAITRTMVNLSIALDMQGKKDEAESLLREVIDTRTHLLGPDDVSLAGPINNLAVIYKSQGRFAESEKLYRQSLQSRERVLGPDHQKTADSVNNLANVLGRLGKWPEAETLHRRALAIREKAFGSDHPRTADSLGNLGIAIDAQGRLPEAEKHLRQALLILETRLGADHPDTIEMCRNLATNLRHQKRDAEAAPFEARLPAGTPTATPAQVP